MTTTPAAPTSTDNIDALAERYGFPKPIAVPNPDVHPGRPVLAAQIDLTETYTRTSCCCDFHGSLHDRRTCCPVHRQTRAGIPVPRMTPIDA